jgi:hypothetical protein
MPFLLRSARTRLQSSSTKTRVAGRARAIQGRRVGRVAWKTSFGSRRARHRNKVAPLRGSPIGDERNGEDQACRRALRRRFSPEGEKREAPRRSPWSELASSSVRRESRSAAPVRGTLRDGLTGRTPGSDPGGRGSIPCPGSRASSSAGTSACLTNRRSLVRGQPRPLSCGRSSAR